MNDNIFRFILVALVGGAIAYFVLSSSGTSKVARIGETHEEVGNKHLPLDQVGEYNTIPATSGDHGQRVEYGEYPQGLSDYDSLHGLEHGAISYWYNVNTVTEADLEQIRATFELLNVNKKYLAPRNDLDDNVKLAMAAWTKLLTQEVIDTDEMKTFFDGNVNRGPELAP